MPQLPEDVSVLFTKANPVTTEMTFVNKYDVKLEKENRKRIIFEKLNSLSVDFDYQTPDI